MNLETDFLLSALNEFNLQVNKVNKELQLYDENKKKIKDDIKAIEQKINKEKEIIKKHKQEVKRMSYSIYEKNNEYNKILDKVIEDKEKKKLLEQSLKQDIQKKIDEHKIEDIPKTNENIDDTNKNKDFEAELIWDDTDEEDDGRYPKPLYNLMNEDDDKIYYALGSGDAEYCHKKCKGWDGDSHRCMCGSRQVCWDKDGNVECY